MDELDRADVEAARRLRRDEHASGRGRSRARGRPSAGSRRRARPRVSAAPPPRTSNSLISRPRALDQPPGYEPAEAGVRRPVGSRAARCSRRSMKSSTSPRCCRSSGMWPTPASKCSVRRVRVTSSPAISTRPARRRLRSPVSASISSVWPLPSTPAIADDLAARAPSNETPRTFSRPRSSSDVQVLDLEQRLARLGRRLLDAQQHLATDHQPRELLLGRACGRQRLDQLARAAGR